MTKQEFDQLLDKMDAKRIKSILSEGLTEEQLAPYVTLDELKDKMREVYVPLLEDMMEEDFEERG